MIVPKGGRVADLETHAEAVAAALRVAQVRVHRDPRKANRAEVTRDLPTIRGYTSRQALRQALEERSAGRLRLDPPAA